MIYLYLKTCNKTGLKYLGKTIKDPFKYNGSGTYWCRHLNKHGIDLSTEILFQTECVHEFKKVAIKYSDELNIVDSKDFANITREEGQGGKTWSPAGSKYKKPYKYTPKVGKNKPLSIHGVKYQSAGIAAKALGIPRCTITYRANTKNPDYVYI